MKLNLRLTSLTLVSALGLVPATHAEAQAAGYLDQGWTSADRHFFYRTSQGSRLLSYRVFIKLERATSTERFASTANLTSMGYVFDADTSDNPDGLPIGFVRDSDWPKPDAVGLTCAACHTRDVTFRNPLTLAVTRLRVDGGQAYSDTERFLRELEAALGATAGDSAKFERLRVAAGVATGSATTALRTELTDALAKIREENLASRPLGSSVVNNPGPGRLDALGHIKNRVANYVYYNNYNFPANHVDADAPVSFPFLWDAPYLDFVQWPGNVANAGLGSLIRNVGEVTGVFAEMNVSRTLGVVTSSSSAKIGNLIDIENKLLKLKSPTWPTALSAINQTKAAAGDVLFNQYCASCHVEVDRNPRTTFIPTYSLGADVVGTDVTQANNGLNDKAYAGLTSSTPDSVVNPMQILASVLAPVLLPEAWRIFDLNASHKQGATSPVRNVQVRPAIAADPVAGTLAIPAEDAAHTYKARPLNGIWAAAPYLHNGSVRTLADLMKPGSERASLFCVGSTELDTVGVGMKNDCFVPNAYVFDAAKPGNSRLGHEYGTANDFRVKQGQSGFHALTAAERDAVVEYMKTL